jgi:hypothetical protein
MPSASRPDPAGVRKTDALSLPVRLYWFIYGYIFTLYSINEIFQEKGLFFSKGDFLYWLSILMLVVMRFIDVKFLHGDTADGNPATIKDFFQYSIMLFVISLVIWGGAHFLASVFDI